MTSSRQGSSGSERTAPAYQPEAANVGAEALNLEEILQHCFECAVLVVDADRRICGSSAAVERLVPIESGEILHRSTSILPHSIQELVEESFQSGTAVTDRPLSVRGKKGDNLDLQAHTTLARDREGKPSSVIVILHESSAAEKLGANMQRLDRLASIGTLSASMAHEIKNALVAVNTFVEDLLHRNKDSELAGLVGRELRRIDSIVSQMLKFAGPAKPTFSRISLHRILDQSLRLIQPQLENKHIRLRRAFGARPDFLTGDAYQLEQAFINIFLNAIAAMESQGQLSVTTEFASAKSSPGGAGSESMESFLRVSIGDTGAGIPAENVGRLFEPFFTTKPQGTGLGLAITRRIILEHRGKVNVESELRKGTTFFISFPLAEPEL